jgi:hypothetical protein
MCWKGIAYCLLLFAPWGTVQAQYAQEITPDQIRSAANEYNFKEAERLFDWHKGLRCRGRCPGTICADCLRFLKAHIRT